MGVNLCRKKWVPKHLPPTQILNLSHISWFFTFKLKILDRKNGTSNPIFFAPLNKIYFSSHSDFQKRGGFTGYAYPYFFIYILTIYYPNTAALSSVPSAQCLLRGATIHNWALCCYSSTDHISLKIQRAFPKASVDHTFASLKSLKNETTWQMLSMNNVLARSRILAAPQWWRPSGKNVD